jgi:hypothetical protein
MAKVRWSGKVRPSYTGGHSTTTIALQNELAPYFKRAFFNTEGSMEPFSANFYCDHHNQPRTYGKVLNIPDGPPPGGNTFYEKRGSISEREGSPNIKLTYRGNTIGLLCPETQTIWGTAWTHYNEYRPAIAHIVEFLENEGLLTKLEPIEIVKPTKDKKVEFSITIGGDPEFELIDVSGEVVEAHGANEFRIFESCGNVGVDGSGDQIELRPEPGPPEVVVDNIRQLLEHFNEHYGEKYKLAASSSTYPCGGHIHIGITPLPDESYYDKLSKILDHFIGKPTRGLNGPARKSDNEYGYGRIGDWRSQDHGMEYRTPPSAVWKNPEFTRIVLKLTYNLATSLSNNLEIEYDSSNLTVQDLTDIGGLLEDEVSQYLSECQNSAPDSNECLLAAWGIEKKVPKPKIRVTYNEDWNYEVKRIINSEFRKVEVSKNVHIILYGLNKERGNVYTFPLSGKQEIPHPISSLGWNHFGFSRRFRDGSTTISVIREAVKVITQVVLNYLDGKIPEKSVEVPSVSEIPISPRQYPNGTFLMTPDHHYLDIDDAGRFFATTLEQLGRYRIEEE